MHPVSILAQPLTSKTSDKYRQRHQAVACSATLAGTDTGRPPAATTHAEINVDPRTTSRRTFLGLAMGVPLAGALAACGSSGPGRGPAASGSGGGAAGSGASYWFITSQPGEGIRKGAVDRFNAANPSTPIAQTAFQND